MNDHPSPAEIFSGISRNIENVMMGQARSIRLLLVAFAGGGHILLEDSPGTGKTTLCKALALSIGVKFRRIQFTPDLLPSDILGVSLFDQREQTFHFHEGPIFTHILLADEINRASPRTQSALLEAMAENQVSIEGNTYRLEELFFVIATQNPVEFRGTYPLPEAQMDRFAMRFSLGYVNAVQEIAILSSQEKHHPLEKISACVTMDDVLRLKQKVTEVRISDEIKRYIVTIVRETRSAAGVQLGASPRASLSLMKTAQAMALLDGREFVTPEDVRELAVPVIAHRMVLDPQTRFSGVQTTTIVQNIIKQIPSPS